MSTVVATRQPRVLPVNESIPFAVSNTPRICGCMLGKCDGMHAPVDVQVVWRNELRNHICRRCQSQSMDDI